jgi:peptide/nickel transport system substrate-binding protein
MARSNDRGSTRRNFLVTTGVAGIGAGLAGCTGDGGTDGGDGNDSDGSGTDGGGGNDSDGGGGGGDPVDSQFTRGVWSVPKNLQYNPYNQSAPYSAIVGEYIHSPLNKPNIQTGDTNPWIASDWGKETRDGKSVYVISLADMVTQGNMPFHDGEGAFDAQDAATKFKLDTYLEYAPANFTDPEKITAGDGEVVIELTKEFNEAILNERFANYRLNAPHHIYEKYLQMFQDGSSDQAEKDLTTLTLDEPVGAGPFQFESASTKQIVLSKFEDHPAADQTNFPEVNFLHTNDNQTSWQALRGGKTDGYHTRFTPGKVVDSYPSHIQEMFIPANWGMGLGFNANNEHYAKRNVRKAIAYAFNREEIAKNAGGDSKTGVERVTGIPGTMQKAAQRIIGEPNVSKMESYGVESKPEEAAAHMKKAGYSKENGNWVGPDGDVPQFPMKVPAGFSDWVSGTQTAVSQMNQFGLNAEMVTVEGSSFWTQWTDGDFKVMAMAWTVGNTVPYLNFNYQLRNSEITENAGWKPEEAQIPPLGKPDGDLQSAEINSKLDKLAKTAVDADNYQARATESAWLTNQLLWRMPIVEKLDQSWYTTDDWNVPGPDSKKNQVHWPQGWHVRTGDLAAKTK